MLKQMVGNPSTHALSLLTSPAPSSSLRPLHQRTPTDAPKITASPPSFLVLPPAQNRTIRCAHVCVIASVYFATSAMDETYATGFSEAHSSILKSISTSVEEPPLSQLKWDFVFHHYGQQHESNYVMQCYIPLNRVSDFVIGEESLLGANCKYVRIRIINNTRHGFLQPHGDNALYIDMCGLHLLCCTFLTHFLPHLQHPRSAHF